MLGSTPGNPELVDVAGAGSGRITVPTLYLHGTDDGCMGIELVVEDEITPFFPARIDIDIVPAAGHFMHLDRPELVTQRILDLLVG